MSARPRRIDRQRRERIIEGALRVIEQRGVEGLTHRQVARAVGVPLGATTYYFATMNDLLAAAMSRTVERDLALLNARFEGLSPDAGIAEPLTDILLESVGSRRPHSIIITELYAAALRREELRAIALAWEDQWRALLARWVGAMEAAAVSSAIAGLIQRALIEGEPPSRELTLATLRYLLRED